MIRINNYIQHLKQYNEHTNIYSKKAYDKLDFHIQDAINIASIIKNKSLVVVDMGSGAGLPAAIIAITNPKNTIIAIESKDRKRRFMNEFKNKDKCTNLKIHEGDVAHFQLTSQIKPDIITAKAFKKPREVIKVASKFTKCPLIIPVSHAQIDNDQLEKVGDIKTINHQNTIYYYLFVG